MHPEELGMTFPTIRPLFISLLCYSLAVADPYGLRASMRMRSLVKDSTFYANGTTPNVQSLQLGFASNTYYCSSRPHSRMPLQSKTTDIFSYRSPD